MKSKYIIIAAVGIAAAALLDCAGVLRRVKFLSKRIAAGTRKNNED